jgi:hypothetical protein
MSTLNANDGFTDAQLASLGTDSVEKDLSNEIKALVAKDLENVTFDFNLQITCLVLNGYPVSFAQMMTVMADRVPHLCKVGKDNTGHGFIVQGGGAQYIPPNYTGPLPPAKVAA